VTEACSPQPCLNLRFFGGCEISLSDEPVHLETAKTRALLIYLASNPTPQPRHRLMGLLWAELPEANARRNLRRALWNLRRRLSSPALPQPILSDRETVCFNREISYWLDVQAFESACLRPGTAPSVPAPSQHLEGAHQAAALYAGEFLEGFRVGGAVGFGEWAIAERERLRVIALRAFRHLVTSYAAQNEIEPALHYARRLLALEPWLEEAHCWIMQLLMRSGRRSEALAQYETCRRVLGEELGVEPAQETQELRESIRTGDFEIPTSNLPAHTTRFVGRARELGEISELLADADCRLLTVTGLGGAGKSRLAREVAAQHVAAFAQGVHYIDLGTLSSPDRLAPALAQSLSIPLIGMADPKAALTAYLREKRILVVMDGFDHLLEEAPILTEILQAARGVKILVTSRERLNLRGEWLYPLAGLAYTQDGDAVDAESCDAVQLLLQTARRIRLGFRAKDGEHHHLVRICSLVAGLPLAIELAAAWVQVLSLEQIADQIAHQQGFLTSSARDRPERHRSVQAVFDQSWRLLSDEEREAFQRLSVFHGSFRFQEAGQVSGASLHVLSALVDKSLLQRYPSGRFQLHELLRQYAYQQLEQTPGRVEATRDRHCRAYAVLLAGYEQTSKDAPDIPTLRIIQEDLDNVLDAWHWAIEGQNFAAIEAMRAGLADCYQLTTSFRDGEALFREALEELGWMDRGEEEGQLPCKLRSSRATFSVYLGRLAEARTDLEHCLAVFDRHGVREEMAHCRFFLGEIARFAGETALAGDFFELSLSGYRQTGNRSAAGFCLNGLGLVSAALGELSQARAYMQDSLGMFRETDHEMGQAISNINLADLLIKLGDRLAAKQALDEGYALCRKLGHRWGMAICLRHLGDIAETEARTQDARRTYQKSLDILQDIGQRQASVGCLIKLGQVCTDLGEYLEARQYLSEALSITRDLDDQAQMVEALAALSFLLAKAGDRERALEVAVLLERRPVSVPAVQERVSRLITELTHQIPEEALQLIQRRSRTLADILRDEPRPWIKEYDTGNG